MIAALWDNRQLWPASLLRNQVAEWGIISSYVLPGTRNQIKTRSLLYYVSCGTQNIQLSYLEHAHSLQSFYELCSFYTHYHTNPSRSVFYNRLSPMPNKTRLSFVGLRVDGRVTALGRFRGEPTRRAFQVDPRKFFCLEWRPLFPHTQTVHCGRYHSLIAEEHPMAFIMGKWFPHVSPRQVLSSEKVR